MTKQRHILIAGGDIAERERLANALQTGEAFRASEVSNAADVMARVQSRTQRFDAIIVNAVLPDTHGSELCARIRRRGLRMPIIVLSDSANEADVVRSLDAGANDCVRKPFHLAELSARLRAQIREHDTSEDAVLPIGPYHLRPAARTLHEPIKNVQIRLTPKEVALLKYLYRASGRPVSRQKLLKEIWSYSPEARTHTVASHIHRLRQKIEPDPACPTILVNDNGGYSLGNQEEGEITWRKFPQPPFRPTSEYEIQRYAYAN
jgi:DNA-binding response OmpR family regulator